MTRKTRILHVYKDIYPPVRGGVEEHIHDVCVGLRDQFNFTIMVAYDRATTRWTDLEGIPLCKVGTWGRFASAPICPTFPWRLAKLARDADLVHYHLPNPTAVISYLAFSHKAPAIVTYHSDIVRQQWALGIYGPFLKAFLKRVALIMPTTKNYVESSAFLRSVKDKCVPVALGIDTSSYASSAKIAEAAQNIRDRYGGAPLIGFVGKLRAYKGLNYLVDAMAEVSPTEAQCLIMGDGPMRQGLEEQARARNVEHRIHFLGERSDDEKVAMLHAIDVFCLPSHLRSEAFGLVQIEAMACGKPVVCCALDTGVPYVNQDGVTGLVVPPASPPDLSEALSRLLSDCEQRKRFGEAARQRAVSKFDRSIMINRIAEIYQDLPREFQAQRS